MDFANVDLQASDVTTNGSYTFPHGFIWSTATAAYQVEGAAFEDGRAPSTWDRFVRLPGKIDDNSTADVACDSYHLYASDIELMKNLGVKQYRFSISWSRILPHGLVDFVNTKGVEYYNKLIAELIKNGIEPMVTLYHWDLPLAIADRGGWLNPQIVDWFGEYARFCFKTFGDQVKHFITLNEPWSQAKFGYANGIHAPGGFNENGDWTAYLVAHHFLLAHATAYHIYDNEFRATQKGQVGITNVGMWFEPETPSDVDAARRALEWQFDWFTHPIFGRYGNYPERMIQRIADRSRSENRSVSRLPSFTQQQIEFVKGSADFLGFNYYTAFLARERRPEEFGKNEDVLQVDAGVVESQNPEWKRIGPPNSWLQQYPEGFRKILNYIRENYNNVTVIITENGCMDQPGEDLEDETRVSYLFEHLKMLSLAINEDHCNVIGYTLWSLMDNFEWSSGYTFRFGIHHVSFSCLLWRLSFRIIDLTCFHIFISIFSGFVFFYFHSFLLFILQKHYKERFSFLAKLSYYAA
ncbi:Beta-glucosidase 6 [Toxocara canis]|uniref:Beta-glucosidase 6 n=1 Tax=Toxocara canis TaxID=6265 RepID=A0A0B2VNT0_TOXCA|nr:Beta-glucosidase 6 [Toxocara canis]